MGELEFVFKGLIGIVDRADDDSSFFPALEFFFEDLFDVLFHIDYFLKRGVAVLTSELAVLVGIDAVAPME